MPEREIAEPRNLPHAVLTDIAVVVDAAFPPRAVRTLGAVVKAGLHHRAAADGGGRAVESDVDHHLELRMIEQPAIARTIVVLGEGLAEAVDIEPPQPRLALVDPAEKPDFGIVGEQI